MRNLKGTIISNKMQKTVVVEVNRLKKHPKYLKYYRVSRKYKAHDEKGEFRMGDVVIISETRPLSKTKKWNVTQLVRRQNVDAGASEIAVEENVAGDAQVNS